VGLMGVSYLISESEYLHTDYQPDCEYADGILIERNLGTTDHSWLQAALGSHFFSKRRQWGIQTYMSLRVRIRAGRYLIPDLCVVAGDRPAEPLLTTPPLIWIEILSPEDQPERVGQKVREVLAFGVPYVWVIDPVTFESDLHTPSGCRKLEDGILRIEGTGIEVLLHALDED
jgi:Uma2 family endonuclease